MKATRPMDVGPLSDATRTSTGSDEVAAGAVALEPQAASDREAATEPTTKPFLVTVMFILVPSFHIMHAARGSDSCESLDVSHAAPRASSPAVFLFAREPIDGQGRLARVCPEEILAGFRAEIATYVTSSLAMRHFE